MAIVFRQILTYKPWLVILLIFWSSLRVYSMKLSRHHRLSRDRAIFSHESNEIRKRRFHPHARTLLQGEYLTKTLSFSDIDHRYITSVREILQNSTCTTHLAATSSTTFDICPSYHVVEYDKNRIPSTLIQVICCNLTCRGPWKGHIRKCTPLFQFQNVLRVVDISDDGFKTYAQVWEPISHSCTCTYGRHHGKRIVMPP